MQKAMSYFRSHRNPGMLAGNLLERWKLDVKVISNQNIGDRMRTALTNQQHEAGPHQLFQFTHNTLQNILEVNKGWN